MTEIRSTTFLEGLTFGEGPRWHDGRLWYSDFYSHAVWSVADDGAPPRREVEVDDQPSGLGWLPDGRLLVVSMHDRRVLRVEADRSLSVHADLGHPGAGRANDMVVDGRGRAYVGSFGFDLEAYFDGTEAPRPTVLLRVDPDGSVHAAAGDLSFPNGMVLFPATTGHDATLVVAETFAGRLTAFDIDEGGDLHNRRQWTRLRGCSPDGICGDVEGAIWVANARAPECLRVRQGGQVLDRVATSQPCFACALGGEDRRTLYCMTAPDSRGRDRVGTQLGRIERTRVPVSGAGLP